MDAIVRAVKRQLPHISTEKRQVSIVEELFCALVVAGLCNFVAPLVFNDVSFYKTPQWFVGVLFLVLVRRKLC